MRFRYWPSGCGCGGHGGCGGGCGGSAATTVATLPSGPVVAASQIPAPTSSPAVQAAAVAAEAAPRISRASWWLLGAVFFVGYVVGSK